MVSPPPSGTPEPAPDDAGLLDDDLLVQGHSYDGIQEYDNPMPGWWVGLFALTVVWAPLYMLGVHVFGFINTYDEDLAASSAAVDADRAAFAASGPAFRTDARSLSDFAAVAANQQAGAATFAATCVACHGDKGQGVIGPNLTDDRWLHGGTAAAIYTVISDGVPTAGMPAWDAQLSEEEQGQVMAFVVSLQGTDPPGAKAPQGEPDPGL